MTDSSSSVTLSLALVSRYKRLGLGSLRFSLLSFWLLRPACGGGREDPTAAADVAKMWTTRGSRSGSRFNLEKVEWQHFFFFFFFFFILRIRFHYTQGASDLSRTWVPSCCFQWCFEKSSGWAYNAWLAFQLYFTNKCFLENERATLMSAAINFGIK